MGRGGRARLEFGGVARRRSAPDAALEPLWRCSWETGGDTRRDREGRGPRSQRLSPTTPRASYVGETGFEPATPWSRNRGGGVRYGRLRSARDGCGRNYRGRRESTIRYGLGSPARTGRARHNPGTAYSRYGTTPDHPRGRRQVPRLQGDRVPTGCPGAASCRACFVRSHPCVRNRSAWPRGVAARTVASRRFKSRAGSGRERT